MRLISIYFEVEIKKRSIKMELLPMITKVLVVTGGIFLLTLTISFITSRFRKEQEVEKLSD